ncbi:MAG: transcription-repair coupling factor [Candidatus Caldatribacterium sp.]|uniref:transcription-repair coupling factor n=1 Tax=Candidatus Caldatribacterium sp. TaxID=2282143 RepID=UPI0029915F09|nr:transcription-repair coupling factor [Candidatus Caldatribacterium sp.]MCX7731149.1 transcription-repair coupling factor [Candidatus Caldatribacterium sp.]MDW8081303.1 transcription-repair coupling factor [Candidatus Calescibacterium sp.]
MRADTLWRELKHLEQELLVKHSLSLHHLSVSFASLLALFLGQKYPVLYVVPHEGERARAFAELGTLATFFSFEVPIFEGNFEGTFRGVVLQKELKEHDQGVLVLAVSDIRRDVEELSYFLSHSFILERNAHVDRGKFLDLLFSLGYERVEVVRERGQVAIRGEVVDLFPPHLEEPVRTYWWGNVLERMRTFDPETQRTQEDLANLFIPPRSGEFRMIALWKILERWAKVAFWEGVFFEGVPLAVPYAVYLGIEKGEKVALSIGDVPSFEGDLGACLRFLKEAKGHVVFFLPEEKRAPLLEVAQSEGIGAEKVSFVAGFLRQGFSLAQWIFLGEKDVFGYTFARGRDRRKLTPQELLASLAPGDYVVHEEEGIGIFQGLREMVVGGIRRVYLEIAYAGGDKLYVPVENAHLVEKYIGIGEAKPEIHRLGKDDWKRTKERVRRSVEKVAQDLLELYARRAFEKGHAFSPDTPWQKELELAFPFLETPDQKRAIEEVKRDMESPRPMDRLVCGDVGYGKTEVAVRAAFKAVMDGKQVAVLAPTTLLSEQHYLTFTERMKQFPVRIAVLNRFRSPKEQEEILEKTARGEIDILIGTHRLLQKDVRFKDLGLLIIDEEQRFGVMHKEHLKKMRTNIDVLTLTATPIPRTLYLSLLGIRDISVIETPPEGRKPVYTLVLPRSLATIEEAIRRELERGGQIFYVCPRIRDLFRVEGEIRSLFPDLPIAVAHGKLRGRELERIMEGFYRGEIPLLLSTTIVEIGIDVPRANTLIVDFAPFFGLAQLYQLRGRVGRFDKEAYAYFLYPKHLTPEARERLEALLEFGGTGSGLKLALRDLEIRGAGNILGTEQHGFIQEVGFSLYVKLLEEEIARQRGEEIGTSGPEPVIRLREEAFIPSSYVESETERLRFYQRLFAARTEKDREELATELEDRFGRMPEEVRRLFEITRLRSYAKITQVVSVEERGDGIYLAAPLEVLVRYREEGKHLGIEGKIVTDEVRVFLRLPRVPTATLCTLFERVANHGGAQKSR